MVYIALLRGVNVGGKSLKMDDLGRWLAELGLADVRTYLQSGNAVFEAGGSERTLEAKIEDALARKTGRPAAVLVRSAAEIAKVLRSNPFTREPRRALYVTFLREAPSKDGLTKLAAIDSGADRWRSRGREIYLSCPGGYGRSKLSNSALERALKMSATTRNWNTIESLSEMALVLAFKNPRKGPRDF